MPAHRAKPPPPRQSLRGSVAVLVLDGDEAAWFSGDAMSEIGRLDVATRTVTTVQTASPPRVMSLVSPGRVVAMSMSTSSEAAWPVPYGVILDCATGKELVELRPPVTRGWLRAVAASPTHVALTAQPLAAPTTTIELFTVDGAHVRSVDLGRSWGQHEVDALIFTADGAALLYVTQQELIRHEVATGQETRFRCEVPSQGNWQPRTTRQGPHLLLQFFGPGHWTEAFVVREADGAVIGRTPGAELVTFGREGELVWQRQDEVRLLSLTGRTQKTTRRRKKARLHAGATTAAGLWIAGGNGGLELIDLHRFDEAG